MGSISLKIGDGITRFKRATLYSSAVSFIIKEIDSSQRKLAQLEKEILGYDALDLSRPNLAIELKLFFQHHQSLPLGKDSIIKIPEMVAFVGHSCEKSDDLLSQFMTYKVSDPCSDDWSLAQKLILKGCEPLPRKRCYAKTIPKPGLTSLHVFLWKPVNDKIATWSGLGCKNFTCLNSKKLSRDCVGCFDLVNGYETQRYVKARSKISFLTNDVLVMGNGGIRIRLE
ncbi:hypothetical protein V6N13_036759 [Hibiscus sabdariffa]